MNRRESFRQRYKYWKETGELPYSNGLKRDLSNQALSEDSPVKSGIPYPMLTSSDYDDARAYELGYFDKAGAKGHLFSNDPETDRILKSPTHPTVGLAIWGDMNMGRDVINKNGLYYSKPNFIQLKINKLPKYDGGTPPPDGIPYIPVNKSPNYIRPVLQTVNRDVIKPVNTAVLTVGDFITSASNKLANTYDFVTGVPLSTTDARQNLYNNILPSLGYENPIKRVTGAITNTYRDSNISGNPIDHYADDAFAIYLQIPENKRRYALRLIKSKYRPTIGNVVGDVYSIPFTDRDVDIMMKNTANVKVGESIPAKFRPYNGGDLLGNYTVSRGRDNKGEYISYYDEYDLNPYRGYFADRDGRDIPILNKFGDLSFGLGKPFTIYDRIYLDDYYNVPQNYRGANYIPEITVTPK